MDEDKNLMEENRISDDELDAVAGGGTYTGDGFLRTTANYGCEHFVCKYCGISKPHSDSNHICKPRLDANEFRISNANECRNCKFHTTLKCNNPLNKK